MMRDYADEANLHARIYAMKSRLLSRTDYAALAGNQARSAPDSAAGPSEPASEEENIFREQIAPILVLAEAVGRYTPIFLSFLRRFEALNVKAMLAQCFGLQAHDQWLDIGPYAVVPASLLRKTDSLKAAADLFQDTYLEEAFEDDSSYGRMEAGVDGCVAKDGYAAGDLLPVAAKADFRALLDQRMAVTAAVLSRRLRRTYQWDDEKIRAYLERFYGAAHRHIQAQRMAVEESLSRRIGEAKAGGAQELSVADMERHLEQDAYRRISAWFHRDFFSVSCVVSYLWLLDVQIRNLFKIVEGRRFGFTPERIMDRIVCGG